MSVRNSNFKRESILYSYYLYHLAHQVTNNGKCGLCGDNWNDTVPRNHETGGKYGVALPTRRYYSGQIITVVVELTSNHKGYFIFKVCSIIYYKMECEDQNLLNRYNLRYVYVKHKIYN